jgi:hypothetical protein
MQHLCDAIENDSYDISIASSSLKSHNDIPDTQVIIEDLYLACMNNEIEKVRNYLP